MNKQINNSEEVLRLLQLYGATNNYNRPEKEDEDESNVHVAVLKTSEDK